MVGEDPKQTIRDQISQLESKRFDLFQMSMSSYLILFVLCLVSLFFFTWSLIINDTVLTFFLIGSFVLIISLFIMIKLFSDTRMKELRNSIQRLYGQLSFRKLNEKEELD